jgi:hypothetical protein
VVDKIKVGIIIINLRAIIMDPKVIILTEEPPHITMKMKAKRSRLIDISIKLS